MKKLFAGIILSLAAVAAMAMPRPSEIENALAAHDYQSAKSMTQEVLRERPDSAKAHLFNAYILAKEGNTVAASEELKNVNRLDRSNDPGRAVHNSALYGRTVAELERAPAQRVAPKPSYSAPTYVPSTTYVTTPVGESALWKVIKWMFWLTVIGAVLYWIYKAYERSNRPVVVTQSWASTPVQPLAVETYERPYLNQGRRYDAPAHALPVQHVAAQPSTVVVNNGGSNSGGIVEGMMLNEMLHSHHSHGHDGYGSPRFVERETYVERPAPAYEAPRYEAPRSTDYETTRSSFSSGSDDDWRSSSSSSSSSSSDYSSGGSDWGSSSSDSGGGGGSDW